MSMQFQFLHTLANGDDPSINRDQSSPFSFGHPSPPPAVSSPARRLPPCPPPPARAARCGRSTSATRRAPPTIARAPRRPHTFARMRASREMRARRSRMRSEGDCADRGQSARMRAGRALAFVAPAHFVFFFARGRTSTRALPTAAHQKKKRAPEGVYQDNNQSRLKQKRASAAGDPRRAGRGADVARLLLPRQQEAVQHHHRPGPTARACFPGSE